MPFSFHRLKSREVQAEKKEQKGTMNTPIFGDKTPDEVKLERSGKINNLQRYRLTQVWGQIRRNNIKSPFDLPRILFIEEDLREVVQEEISIKEGTTLNKDAKERLDALNANTGS